MGFAVRCRIALVLLPLVATACRSLGAAGQTDEPALVPARANAETAARPERPVDAPTAQEIRTAMIAVYARVVGALESGSPERLNPISLERAAAILQRDAAASTAGQRRLRRAIMRLTLAGLEVHDDGTYLLKYRDFLDAVGASRKVDAIVTAWLRPRDGVRTLDQPKLTDDLYRGFTTASLEGCYSQLILPPVADQSANCGHTQMTGAARAQVTVVVTRELTGLSRSLDPQSWDEVDWKTGIECNPFFEGGACAAATDLSCLDCPPSPGSDWSGVFKENFAWDWDPFKLGLNSKSSFHLALDVKSDIKTDSYRADFCLNQPIYLYNGGKSCGSQIQSDPGCGTIDIDEGFSNTTSIGAGTYRINAEKWLRFAGWHYDSGLPADAGMNSAAQTLLLAMGEGLEEQACCEVIVPPVCVGSPQPGSTPPPPVILP